MKQLSKYKLNTISKNLDAWFNIATKDEISDGISWYPKANEICVEYAKEFKTTSFVVAGRHTQGIQGSRRRKGSKRYKGMHLSYQ